jgi:hypothetical protein
METLHAPSLAQIGAASSVDAIPKQMGLKSDSLSHHIDETKKNHLVTPERAEWASEVRLDTNDERHAEKDADLPTREDSVKIIDFAMALAEFLFVLPIMVTRGRSMAGSILPTASTNPIPFSIG